MFVIAALCIAALIMLSLSAFEPRTLLMWSLWMEHDPSRPHFSIQEIIEVQHRAMAAGFAYLILAAILGWIGSLPASRIIADANAIPRLSSISRYHRLCLLAMTTVVTLFVANYADQVIRLDEAMSFMMYGTGSVLVPAALSGSTNNHVFYSLMMWLSVALFGDAEWAIRLPAAIAAVATVPALYLAGRRLLGSESGLVAAAGAAGSVYTIELATNARGYSSVNLAFLLTLALLPTLKARRTSMWCAFVLLFALGAWAVPIMIYPFAIAVVWLLIDGFVRPPATGRIRWMRDVLLAVLATGTTVLLLYSPSLVVVGLEEQGTRRMLAQAQEPDPSARFEALASNIHRAWEQWTYPAPHWVALATLVACGVGVIISLSQGGRARTLVIAAISGPVAVLMGTRLASPPWWSLTFAYPIYLLFIAHAITSLRQLGSRPRESLAGVLTAATVMLVVSFCTLRSSYPDYFPHYAGHRDARHAAEYLSRYDFDGIAISGELDDFPHPAEHRDARHEPIHLGKHGFKGAWVVTSGLMGPPLAYYVYRRGDGGMEVLWHPNEASPAPTRLFRVVANCGEGETAPVIAQRYEVNRRNVHQLSHSWMLSYKFPVRAHALSLDDAACGGVGR